jgi:excisionase family DNA binding protein
MDELLTVDEAAAIFKVQPSTIRRWLRDGTLMPANKISDSAGWRVARSEVERLAYSGQQKKEPPESEDPRG